MPRDFSTTKTRAEACFEFMSKLLLLPYECFPSAEKLPPRKDDQQRTFILQLKQNLSKVVPAFKTKIKLQELFLHHLRNSNLLCPLTTLVGVFCWVLFA